MWKKMFKKMFKWKYVLSGNEYNVSNRLGQF